MVVALGVLALTTGLLVGQTGADAAVLAAVLPIVVAGGGSAALGLAFRERAKNGKAEELPASVRPAAAAGVIVFSMMLLVGIYGGGLYRTWTQSAAYSEANSLRLERLRRCTLEEVWINRIRTDLKLNPLPIHVVCPDFPPHDVPGLQDTAGSNPGDEVNRGDNSRDQGATVDG